MTDLTWPDVVGLIAFFAFMGFMWWLAMRDG